MRWFFLLFSFFFVCASASHAGYKMGEKGTVPTSGPAASKKTKEFKFPFNRDGHADPEKDVLLSLSSRYKVPVDRLEYFRGLHHGYEEIVPALIVAREAQVEPGRVLKMRMDGQTWKTVADSFSIDLKPLNQEVLEVLKPIRKTLPKQALTERPQTRN